jgi:hypothetical protein
MSFFVGGAIIGTAAITAYTSDRASDKQSSAIKSGVQQSSELANRARQDAIALFDNAAKRKGIGLDQALSFYKQNALKRMQPFVQGNQAAQNVIGRGAQQANNAILGLPVDMSFVNQQQPNVDYSGINAAALPSGGLTMGQAIEGQAQPTSTPDAVKAQGKGGLQMPSNTNIIFGRAGAGRF